MKKVWILNHYAQEPGGPGGTRHFSLAQHLREFGWEASIIAASTELNTGRQRLSARESSRTEIFSGIPFHWIRTPAYEGNGIGRMINMLAYTGRSLFDRPLAGLGPPDVVIGSSVHPLAAWAGARLAARYRVPFMFEVRDLWPQTLIDLGRIAPNGLQARVMRTLEKSLYRRAARIISLLPRAWEYIEPLGVPRQRVVWIPNGIDLCAFPWQPPRAMTEPFVFMYFGAHGNANGLENILGAQALLEQKEKVPPRLRLIGDGPLKSRLMEVAASLGLQRVTFESPVSKSAIPRLAAQADAFVFNLVDAPVFRYGISSNKLFDFLGAGRPVVFCCDAANNPVAEADAGPTVRPGNPRELADAMGRIMRMSFEERSALGSNARRYVERTNDFRILAKQLAAILDAAVAE